MSLRDDMNLILIGHSGQNTVGQCTTDLLALIRKAVEEIKNPVPISRTGEYLGFCEGIKAVEKLLEVK
uniref:Uncharacterized protein n=1 Tax=viral metagenome TaxID=1070528 RepID=A0A6M3KX35_9ZZZZ